MAVLERVPREGDVVRLPGAELHVERMHGLAVETVLLRELPIDDAGGGR